MSTVPVRLFDRINTSGWKIGDPLTISPIVLGGAVFSAIYNDPETVESDLPEQTILAAFRYGINTVDTSPWYEVSEAIIGKAFAAISEEFPRNSYQIITKTGRFPPGETDYSPARIRKSIARSMELFGTTYLDAVYMHDVEFVVAQVGDTKNDGRGLCEDDFEKLGLASGDEDKIRSEGDQIMLDAMKTLFEMKREGKIRAVGFSGYPLPTLLRIARLVAFHVEPVDILQTYAHHTLQNSTLSSYLPLFAAAGVKQVVSASPLCMGLLTTAGGPFWHPASPELKATCREAVAELAKRGKTLEEISLGYGFASATILPDSGKPTPTVAGFSNPDELHQAMGIYSSFYETSPESRRGRKPGEGLGESKEEQEQLECEKIVVECFKSKGTYNQTWK